VKYLLFIAILFASVTVGWGQQMAAKRYEKEASTTFPGGMHAFYKFVDENLKYPRDARKEGVVGKVLIEFTVDQKGDILPGSVRVLKRLHPSCDEEASRLVRMSSPWLPGTFDGEPVAQRMAVTISFGQPNE